MLLLVVLLITLGAAHEDALKAILRSPKATLRAYGQYKAAQHLSYTATEDRMRLRMWRKTAELVAEENSKPGHTATLGFNFFSVMTPEERKQYLGLNVTAGHVPELTTLASLQADPPAEKDWTKDGLVTQVKNQAACGSCWTFGAVGGLETRYALLANGALRNFAEQEYLDCTYESLDYDGCNGGWMQECYQYSADNGGRLAATADYPYVFTDTECKGSSKPDAMVAAKITGYEKVGTTEKDNVAAIADGPITVAFEVSTFFQSYSTGIIKDMTCTGMSNHAVTAVGYTAKYILVKNSWGSGWGEDGFVRYMRGHHNCNLYKDSYYPVLTETGKEDTTADDPATDYVVPENDDRFNPPICEDKYKKCTASHCKNVVTAEKYCAKTCNRCPKEDGCPKGTILCSDDVCRHEHMCPK